MTPERKRIRFHSRRRGARRSCSAGLRSDTRPLDMASRSRRVFRASFILNVLPTEDQRAQGMPGARCARSRACSVVNTRVSHHGHTGITRHSPRNGFNALYRALPGDRAFLPPSSLRSLLLKNLTPASGRQDHTTSPSASASFVRALFAHLTLPRPPHPAAYVRDDRETPLCVGRDGDISEVICARTKQEYFCKGGWTAK